MKRSTNGIPNGKNRRRHFIMLVLAMTLPVLALSAVIYQIYLNNLMESLSVSQGNQLAKQEEQLNTYVKESIMAAQLASVNPVFINAVNNSHISKTENEINLLSRQIMSEVNALVQANPRVKSAYLLCGLDGIVYSSIGGVFSQQYFFDLGWQSQYDSAQSNVQLLSIPRHVNGPFGEDYRYITVASKLPYLSFNNNGVLLINIEVEKFFNAIFLPKASDMDHSYVFDGSGNLVLGSAKDFQNSELIAALQETLAKNPGARTITIGQEEYLLAYSVNKASQWKSMTLTSIARVKQLLEPAIIQVIPYFLVYLAIVICFSIFITNRQYRPIRKIIDRIAQTGLTDGHLDKNMDEFSYIKGSIEETTALCQRQGTLITDFQNAIIEKSVFELLFQNVLDGESKAKYANALSLLAKPDDNDLFSIILIKFDSKIHANAKAGDPLKKSLHDAICQDCSAITEESYRSMWLWLDTHTVIGVLKIQATIPQPVRIASFTSLGAQLHDKCIKLAECPATVAFGTPQTDFLDLRKSFSQALELVNYKLFNRVDLPFCYEQFVRANIEFNFERQKALSNQVKLGKETEARDILQKYFSLLMTESNANSEYIRNNVNQIVRLIYQVLSGMNGIPQDTLDNKKQIYEKIDKCGSIQDMAEHVLTLAGDACRLIQDSNHSKGERRMIDLINWINQNYTSDISLNEIAERLELSQTYASRLFKSHTGSDLITYVNGIKLEHAKTLLKDTKMSVAQIGTFVGFNHQQSFIRCFKKSVGMTPSNYRNLSGSDAAETKDSIEDDELQLDVQ